jgi:Tfp pilus assembly protein PilV
MRRGLSLAEFVIALALMGMVGVAVVGLLLRMNLASTKTMDQTAALDLAHRVLEQAEGASPDSWPSLDRQTVKTRDGNSEMTFEVSLTSERISDPASPMGDLYRLRVEVQWWPPSSSNRRDFGKLRLVQRRIVYVENQK